MRHQEFIPTTRQRRERERRQLLDNQLEKDNLVLRQALTFDAWAKDLREKHQLQVEALNRQIHFLWGLAARLGATDEDLQRSLWVKDGHLQVPQGGT